MDAVGFAIIAYVATNVSLVLWGVGMGNGSNTMLPSTLVGLGVLLILL